MIEEYIEWGGCIRLDADGDDICPLVHVYFEAGGYQPYASATRDSPAEGGGFEDMFFLRVEIDPRSLPTDPLTDAEIAAAKAWFDTEQAWDYAQRVALESAAERDQ